MRRVVSGTEVSFRLLFRNVDGAPADPSDAWVTTKLPSGALVDTPAVQSEVGLWIASILHDAVGLWRHEAHGEGGAVTVVSRTEIVSCQAALS